MSTWKLDNMPDLTGKVAVVTGGNAGLGFESSLNLAKNGAQVVIACRDSEKGKSAINRIKSNIPNASVESMQLDLTDFKSIDNFSESFRSRHDKLDILLNNAAVVSVDQLQHTKDGHEIHMATNHYGHFALTGRLLPIIKKTSGSRIVTVSSGGSKFGKINFDDLEWNNREYHRVKAYSESKLANLLFMIHLQKLFEKYGINSISLAAHPGLTGTDRQQSKGASGKLFFMKWLASSVNVGVSPQLYAATADDIQGGDYYGPKFGIWGAPSSIKNDVENLDLSIAKKLWDLTEKVTGVNYVF